MSFLSNCVVAGAIVAWPAFIGCSKKAPEAPAPPPAVEQTAAPENTPAPAQNVTAAPIQNVQQVNANFDVLSKDIANQNYENAIRTWATMEQARRQAQMNEAARKEYERRFFLAQEALRQKAETDPKAREAYQALGRAVTGR